MSINMNQDPQNVEFRGNHADFEYAPIKWGSQIIRRSTRVFKGTFNFANPLQGGAIGSIPLMDPVFSADNLQSLGGAIQLALPANFIISNVLIDGIVALVGAGASVALSSGQNPADLLAATSIAASPFNGTIAAGIPVSAATAIKIPANQAYPGSLVSMVVSGAALTAGQFNVHIEGFLSDQL